MFHGLLTAEQHQQAMEIQANLTDGQILEYLYAERDYQSLKLLWLADNKDEMRNAFAESPDGEWVSVAEGFREKLAAYMAAHYRAKLAALGQILPEIVEDVAGVEVGA